MAPTRSASSAASAVIMPTLPPDQDLTANPKAALVSIGSLMPDARNARRRTPRSREMLAHSLQEFGAARSIVVDETCRVLAGSGTLEAAQTAGIDKVLLIPSDGNTLIAVQRRDLSETEKTSLALADNRTSDTSEFDGAMLAQLVEEDAQLDISPWFSEEEFAALVAGDQVDEAETEPPAPPSKPDSGLEIKLQFATQEEFDRFGSLLVQLAAALPEPAELTGRLALVIEAYLDREGRQRQRRQPRA